MIYNILVIILLIVFACSGLGCLKGTVHKRVGALQVANTITVLILTLFSFIYNRDIYLDTALCLAILSLPGSLIYIRFLERWL